MASSASSRSYYGADEFKEKFPKADGSSFEDMELGEAGQLWFEDGKIRVAKVWKKVPVKKFMLLLSDGRTVWEDQLTDEDAQLQVMRSREANTHEVWCWIQSATEILEGPNRLPGKMIPLVPVYGEEMNIQGKIQFRGLIRTAKDPQRSLNYARTTQAEILAQQPKSPWLLGASQMTAALKGLWSKANSSKLPYLLYDDKSNPNLPQRQPPALPSQGYMMEVEQAEMDIQRATGYYEAAVGNQGNEVSGRAILARQNRADDGVQVFSDNLAASIEHAGRILLELIPVYYDTNRVLRLRGEDESSREVEINKPVLKVDENGRVIRAVQHDLTRGKYDIRIYVGPGYKTKMLEAADSMFAFLQAVPQAFPFVADLIMLTQDWPMANEFAERLKHMVPPGAITDEEPTEEQQKAMNQQQQLEMLRLRKEFEKLDAEINKDKAAAAKDLASARTTAVKGELDRANIEKTEAETLKAEAETEMMLRGMMGGR